MPSDSAQRIKEMMPQAQCTVMSGVAHFLPFQAPERFALMVTEFLDQGLNVQRRSSN